MPGIANWALAELRRLRAAGGRLTLGEGHKRLAGQYAAETSPIMAWVRSEMVVHRRADPGDLPPESLTRENVSIAKSDAYDLYCVWCESHDIEPTRPAWFGRDLKTLIPKLQEGRDTRGDGSRSMVYRGIGVRPVTTPDETPGKDSDCAIHGFSRNGLGPVNNGAALSCLSGQSGHFHCFLQLSLSLYPYLSLEKVGQNNPNALTALTQPPGNDSQGGPSEKAGCTTHRKSNDEARRLCRNLRLEFSNGYVVQPEPTDLSIWRVGKDVEGTVRWLDQAGTREWAVGEVQRRLAPKPVPPPVPEHEGNDTDSVVGTTADVLNTLICHLDDGKFGMADPDDLDDLECQITPALDIPETAGMAEALLLDLEDGCVILDDVRQRVDEMLAVLLQMEEEEMDHKKEKLGAGG